MRAIKARHSVHSHFQHLSKLWLFQIAFFTLILPARPEAKSASLRAFLF